jgi:hypothetical protein
MINKLVYTVSDLRESSIKCIDLLYQSLLKQNRDIDFFVVTNADYSKLNKPYKFLYDNLQSTYIGWLKYSKSLPLGYDSYIYFDSDILCYELLDNLIGDFDFSLVIEKVPMSTKWFCYPFATESQKIDFQNISGINAGTYVFKNLDFIDKVRHNYRFYDIQNTNHREQAMFEQSCFNYSLIEYVKDNQFYDISKYVRLFANDDISENTIYHFCGYEGFMDNKLKRMLRFNQKYL